MFKERKNPDTEVEILHQAPFIGVETGALIKMETYVKECSDEIGWLGTATRDDNGNITIHDVYLFEQDVHATTTEITPQGLESFANDLLIQGDAGIEIWNNLKAWGHSHVNMGVSPSGQDDKQMETFEEGGHDWFIRIIANKKGDMKVDLYDYDLQLIYLDLPWIELADARTMEIRNQIDELYDQLDEIEATTREQYSAPIKEEIKDKVRKMSYTHKSYNPNKSQTPVYKNGVKGYYVQGTWVSEKELLEEEKKTHGGATTKTSGTTTTTGTALMGENEEDLLTDDDDVFYYFSVPDLVELGYVRTFQELEEELYQWGYGQMFTENDLEIIFRVAYKTAVGGVK